MIRATIGVVLGAVVMFFWGFVFWTMTPVPMLILNPLPNEASVVSILQSQNLPAGHYIAPTPDEAAYKIDPVKAEAEAMEKRTKGPIMTIIYQPGGCEMGMTMGLGFVHMLISSAFMAVLLYLAAPGLMNFGSRWLFVTLVGAFAAVNIHLGNPVWFQHTWLHAGAMAGFETVSWVLAGVPLAALVKRSA